MPNNPSKAILTPSSKHKAISIQPLNEKSLASWLKKATAWEKTWVKDNGFKASLGEILIVPARDGSLGQALWGLGEASLPTSPWEYAKLPENLPNGVYILPNNLGEKRALNAALGWSLAHYSFDNFKTEKAKSKAKLVQPNGLDKRKLKALLEATILVRDLINTPTNFMSPSHLEEGAKEIAKKFKASFKVTTGNKLLEENFPTIHAVGRASEDEPRLIDIRWGKKTNPKVTLVGKVNLTF